MPAPNTKQRRDLRGMYASLTARAPGSPEALEAGRKFWVVTAVDGLRDCMDRSPLPFTPEQIDGIIEVLRGSAS